MFMPMPKMYITYCFFIGNDCKTKNRYNCGEWYFMQFVKEEELELVNIHHNIG